MRRADVVNGETPESAGGPPEPAVPPPTRPLPDLPDQPTPFPVPGDPPDPSRTDPLPQLRPAGADRGPTPQEESAAERAARDVDLQSVAKEFEHMNEVGADVGGEGEIEPTV